MNWTRWKIYYDDGKIHSHIIYIYRRLNMSATQLQLEQFNFFKHNKKEKPNKWLIAFMIFSAINVVDMLQASMRTFDARKAALSATVMYANGEFMDFLQLQKSFSENEFMSNLQNNATSLEALDYMRAKLTEAPKQDWHANAIQSIEMKKIELMQPIQQYKNEFDEKLLFTLVPQKIRHFDMP